MAHDIDHFFALLFENLQVIPVNLNRELSFDPADSLLHVVFNGLRKIPEDPGNSVKLPPHGPNQRVLIAVKHRTPPALGLKIDKIFGVEESGSVSAVVGAPDLAGRDGDFRETGQYDAG